VLRTLPDKHKIVVKGVNILKRHQKAGQSRGGVNVAQGGVVDFEAPLDYSNVMLVCPSCGKPTRTQHTVLESGARALLCRHCGEPYERVRKTEAQ
jgi:large subunit ribosomal protein L24